MNLVDEMQEVIVGEDTGSTVTNKKDTEEITTRRKRRRRTAPNDKLRTVDHVNCFDYSSASSGTMAASYSETRTIRTVRIYWQCYYRREPEDIFCTLGLAA